MRRFFIAFLFFVGTLSGVRAFTVVDGDGAGLAGTVSLQIDFSETTVEGISLDEYLDAIGESDDFEYETRKYYADFIKRFNGRCGQLMLTHIAGKPITLTVKVMNIVRKGNDAICSYVFTETESGRVLLSVSERTREGRVGTFTNLVGDVMREAGGDFGSSLSRYLKKKSKSNKYTDSIYE